MKRIIRFYSILLVIVVLFGVWNTATKKASTKPLWHDELNELNITCRWSFSDIIIFGAYTQCSATPLYYLLSKAFFNIFRVSGDKPYKEILIESRIFSKISVVLLILVVFILYRKLLKMEWIWMPLVLSTFFDYLGSESGHILWASAETRPYGFWILLIGLNLLFLHVIHEKWMERSRRTNLYFVIYGVVSFALITTVTPGIIQVLVPPILIFSLWRYEKIKALFELPRIFGSLFILLGVLVVLYYNLFEQCKVPVFYGNAWGTIIQFFTGFRTPVMFMIMMFGWIHVIRNMKSVISRMVISQFIILLMMVAIVHIQDYHFVPRVFIMGHFLSFYLAVAGCRELNICFQSYSQGPMRMAKPLLCFLMIAVSVYHSTSLREIIKYGIIGHEMTAPTKMVDQKNDIVFPLCSEKRK